VGVSPGARSPERSAVRSAMLASMPLAPHDVWVRLALAGAVGVGVLLVSPAVHAQERSAYGTSAEIIDPFVTMPRARAAGAAIGAIMAELLDPFASAPARSTPARVVGEILDPFVTGGTAASARTEILDPWSS